MSHQTLANFRPRSNTMLEVRTFASGSIQASQNLQQKNENKEGKTQRETERGGELTHSQDIYFYSVK